MEKDDVSMKAISKCWLHTAEPSICIYGTELFCGWCLQSFSCPVRLKIHFHIEHLITCSCGEKFSGHTLLREHILATGCGLPSPFQWTNFLSITDGCPGSEVSETAACEGPLQAEQSKVVDKFSGNQPEGLTTFETVANFSTAKKVNSHQKAFKCRWCGSNFALPSALKLHAVRCSLSAKFGDLQFLSAIVCQRGSTYPCRYCSASFQHRHSTYRHIRQHHAKRVQQWLRTKSMQSSASSSKWAKRPDILFLQRVVQSKHGKFPCKFCSAVFRYRGGAYRHIRAVHGEQVQKWMTGNAIRSVSNKSEDLEFLRTVVQKEGNKFACKFCRCVRQQRSHVYRHIRHVHANEVKKWMLARTSQNSSDIQTKSAAGQSQKAKEVLGSDVDAEKEQLQEATADGIVKKKLVVCSKCCTLYPETNYDLHQQCCPDMLSEDAEFLRKFLTFVSDGTLLCCQLCGQKFSAWSHTVEHLQTAHSSVLQTSRLTTAANVDQDVKPSVADAGSVEKATKQLSTSQNTEMHSAEAVVVKQEIVLPTDSDYDESHERLPVQLSHTSATPTAEAMTLSSGKPDDILPVDDAMKKGKMSCPHCSRCMPSKSIFNKHKRNCHRNPAVAAARMRRIHNDGYYYCIRCGFYDSEKSNVIKHAVNDVHFCSKTGIIRPPKDHDYMRQMQQKDGTLKCHICTVSLRFRSKMLEHLRSHSSSSASGLDDSNSGSSCKPVKAVDRSVRGSAPASFLRSCPNCQSSFRDVAAYLRHRLVCRVIRHGKVKCRNPSIFDLCKETTGGCWQCKLCKSTYSHRSGLYKHIRKKHKTKLSARDVVPVKRQRHAGRHYFVNSNGRLQCTFCSMTYSQRGTMSAHILRMHRNGNVDSNTRDSTVGDSSAVAHVNVTPPGNTAVAVNKSPEEQANVKSDNDAIAVKSSEEQANVTSLASCNTAADLKSPEQHANMKTTIPAPGRKNFSQTCRKCGRVFCSQYNYARHACMCGTSATVIDVRDATEKLPTGRFRCRVCDKNYGTRGHAVEHIRLKHLKSPEPPSKVDLKPSEPPSKVEQTPTASSDNNTDDAALKLKEATDVLFGKIAEFNTELKKWTCKTCNVVFRRRRNAYRHVRFRHIKEGAGHNFASTSTPVPNTCTSQSD